MSLKSVLDDLENYLEGKADTRDGGDGRPLPNEEMLLLHALSEARSSEAVDEGCICNGNWRAIVKEYGPKIGQTFKRGDKTYRFFGIVHGDDDYYYGLVELGGKVVLSSCVGSLETMGFDDESSPTAGEGKSSLDDKHSEDR